jgi:hypothetical protein
MGIVTLQTTLWSGSNALMARIQNRRTEVMAVGAKIGHRSLFLRGMGIMTATTVALNRRRMTDTTLPIGIDLMTGQTKRRLFL